MDVSYTAAIVAGPTMAARNRSHLTSGSTVTGLLAWLASHPVVSVFLVALLVRFAIVGMSDLFEAFVLDDGTYHQMAMDMAAGEISHWDDFTYSLFWRTAAFLIPVTGFYKLFGPEIIVGQLYVAVVGALAVAVVTRLAIEVLSTKWAVVTGLVLALLPSQAFWSSQLMKDASVWLTLASLGTFVAIANRSTGRRLIACGLGVALMLCSLAFLREHTLVVAAWATLIASTAGIREQRSHRILGTLVLATAIPWFVAATGPAGLSLVTNSGSLQELRFKMAEGANTAIVDTTPGGTEAELNALVQERQALEKQIAQAEAEGDERETEKLRERREEVARNQDRIRMPPPGAGITQEEGTLEPNIAHLPKGLSVMLLEPFPLPLEGSASLRLARLESVIWYPILMLATMGLWLARRQLRPLLFPMLAGGGILVMYALSEGNVGTAYRHRGEFVWVVVLLAGLGAARLVEGRNPQERQT